jgi:hypothetical protein
MMIGCYTTEAQKIEIVGKNSIVVTKGIHEQLGIYIFSCQPSNSQTPAAPKFSLLSHLIIGLLIQSMELQSRG